MHLLATRCRLPERKRILAGEHPMNQKDREHWKSRVLDENFRRLGRLKTIPKDISFDEAEATLGAVVSFLETQRIVPFTFPLPD